MSGNAYKAEQLKEQGNQYVYSALIARQYQVATSRRADGYVRYFKEGDYGRADECYSQAIQKNSHNPLLFTNRAFARLKLQNWNGVIDDCLRSIDLLPINMKAYFYLGMSCFCEGAFRC